MTDAPHNAAPCAAAETHEGLAHVMPAGTLLAVFAALMVLTFVTVAATWIDLGAWNLWIALAIASVKSALVALYFMHLRYDSPFNSLIFVTGLLFLWLFLAITLIDAVQYQPDVQLYLDAAP